MSAQCVLTRWSALPWCHDGLRIPTSTAAAAAAALLKHTLSCNSHEFVSHHLGVRLGVDELEELHDVISVHRLPFFLLPALHIFQQRGVPRVWGG